MTNIDYTPASEEAIDELSEPVVLEKDDVESLRADAQRAEELDDRLDEMNSTLDELSAQTDVLDEVDEAQVEELREADDPVVLSEAEHEELQSLVDEVGEMLAEELAEYSPFDAAELQENFSPLRLREKVEEHDEASIESELGESDDDPEPEGGAANPDELGDDSSVSENSKAEAREKIADQLAADGMARQAEKVRSGDITLDELGVEVTA